MNGETARTVRVPLDFLSKNVVARIWTDGVKPDAVALEARKVTRADTIELPLAATGGAVAIFSDK